MRETVVVPCLRLPALWDKEEGPAWEVTRDSVSRAVDRGIRRTWQSRAEVIMCNQIEQRYRIYLWVHEVGYPGQAMYS